MPIYTYSAKDQEGQTISGQVSAPDERTAASHVRNLGFYPMNLRPTGFPGAGGAATAAAAGATAGAGVNVGGSTVGGSSVGSDSVIGASVPLGGRQFVSNEAALGTPFVRPYGSWFERSVIYPVFTGVSLTQLALFYRQFSAMLASGMTITSALATLSRESDSALRTAAIHMNKHVTAGGRLSEAMAMFPHIFNRLQREMVAASEMTGDIHLVMLRLSEYLEADATLRRMIKRETFMPKVNFVATFLIPTLVVAVMHGMTAYFNQAVMPLLKLLFDFAVVWTAGRYALKSNTIAVIYDTFKAYLPYFGTTVRMLAIAKFARALSSLFSSGVLIPTAVDIASRTTGNAYLTWQMQKTVPAMMAGAGLTESFRRTGVFPNMFLSMLATGEKTGGLDITLTKLAEYYEAESAVRLHQSVQALNVLIFLVVAVIVGIEVIHFWTGYANSFSGMMNDNN